MRPGRGMARTKNDPTGVERPFADDEIIVSKTDLQGKITYVNDVFIRVAEYGRDELIGAPHSIIRHPAMPRCIYRLMWNTIEAGREMFAYVVNLAKSGDHYWVYAHVTPTFGNGGGIIGYHSNRRTVKRSALPAVEALYATLLAEERRHDRRDAIAASEAILDGHLADHGMSYDEYVWSL